MKLKVQRSQDAGTRQLYQFLKNAFPGISTRIGDVVFRSKGLGIHICLVHGVFRPLGPEARHAKVTKILKSLPEALESEVSMVITMTPEEFELHDDPVAAEYFPWLASSAEPV